MSQACWSSGAGARDDEQRTGNVGSLTANAVFNGAALTGIERLQVGQGEPFKAGAGESQVGILIMIRSPSPRLAQSDGRSSVLRRGARAVAIRLSTRRRRVSRPLHGSLSLLALNRHCGRRGLSHGQSTNLACRGAAERARRAGIGLRPGRSTPLLRPSPAPGRPSGSTSATVPALTAGAVGRDFCQ